MTYSASDFTDDVIAQLEDEGYVVHSGVADNPEGEPHETAEEVDANVWWFSWIVLGADVEVGANCSSSLEAWFSALNHRLDNSEIPLHITIGKT